MKGSRATVSRARENSRGIRFLLWNLGTALRAHDWQFRGSDLQVRQ